MCTILSYSGKDIEPETLRGYLQRNAMRGPDDVRIAATPFGYFGFARLAIMGLTPEGMQPFERDGNWVVCNGEIYGFRRLRWKRGDIPFTAVRTAKCCFRFIRNTGLRCLRIWMRNLPAFFTTEKTES